MQVAAPTTEAKGAVDQAMADTEPVAQQSIATNGVTTVTPWAQAREGLADMRRYWLTTVRPDRRPHVMPLFAVWLDGAIYFTASNASRKARNLQRDPHCVISAGAEALDLVVEGQAVKVRDEATLRRVAAAYAAKYGWQLTVRDGTYFADYGAPSAGPPPYDLYQVTPAVAFGLGTAEPFGATRWRFERA
jgi:hypothetical protein